MKRSLTTIAGHLLPPVLFLILVLVLWQAYVVVFDVKAFLVPAPLEVARTMSREFSSLARATVITGAAALSAFVLSLLLGTVVSFCFAQFTWVRRSCYPYAIFLQTVPIVAIAPIIITWYGSGFHSIVVVGTIISLFPIITNVTTGLTSVPPQLLDLFRVHQANSRQIQFKLRFPFALRYLVTGAKTSSGLAVVGAIVGEFFAGHGARNHGLGYIILSSSQQLKTAELFAAVILSTLLGIIVFLSVSALSVTVLRRWTHV